MKYSLTYPYKDPNTKDILLIVDNDKSNEFPQLSYILDRKDSSIDEELLWNVEGVITGNPLSISYQVINDFIVDIKNDFTRIINDNLDDESTNTDIIPTKRHIAR